MQYHHGMLLCDTNSVALIIERQHPVSYSQTSTVHRASTNNSTTSMSQQQVVQLLQSTYYKKASSSFKLG